MNDTLKGLEKQGFQTVSPEIAEQYRYWFEQFKVLSEELKTLGCIFQNPVKVTDETLQEWDEQMERTALMLSLAFDVARDLAKKAHE